MMIEDTPTPVLFPEEILDPPIQTRSYGMTDVGLVRPRNEDNFECNDEHMFFVVADGMGGETRGDLASRIAIDAIREIFVKSDEIQTDPPANDDPVLANTRQQLAPALVNEYTQQLTVAIRNEISVERNDVAIDAVRERLLGN